MLLIGAVKAASADAPTFEGWASTSALDHDGDVVMPSAFAESLPAFIDNGPIYWQHEERFNPTAMPIGKTVDARIADNGVWIVARWAKTPQADEVRGLVLDGIVGRLSVGFVPRQMRRDASGVNVISKADLFEVSVVALPANPEARIVVAKAHDWLDHHEPLVPRRRVITRIA